MNRARRRQAARDERREKARWLQAPKPMARSLHKPVDGSPREGKLNRYTCERCGGSVVTVDREEGVTPFMIRCRSDVLAARGCGAMMQSHFYRDVEGEPEYEWRKPSTGEYRRLSAAMRDHVDRGGLLIYALDLAPPSGDEETR
jgi:hypothetical protein